MSRLDELPPDQRAALSLLLRQRKSYAEVAVLLGIGEAGVHDRAHAALAVLAPMQARTLTPAQRQEITDYMLSQQASISERLRTRTFLGGSEPARAWAQALAAELTGIAGVELPEIPAPAVNPPVAAATAATAAAAGATALPAAPTPPPAAPGGVAPARPQFKPSTAASGALAEAVVAAPSETQPPSSRVGGALLLAALVVAVVVAVILISNGGGGKGASHASTSKGGKTSSTVSTSSAPGKVDATVKLLSPDPASRSIGEAEVVSDGNARVFAIIAANLPATHNFYYALWLYNSPTSAIALAQAPAVGASHKLEAYGALPSYARNYHEVLLTRETATKPAHPGQVILHGVLSLKE